MFNMLWSAPFQMGLCIYFMYQELQGSVFVGMGIMILAIPLFGVVGGFGKKYQLQQMEHKDKRVKMMNEVLGGIKVLKLYGWEPSFMKQVRLRKSRHANICSKNQFFRENVVVIAFSELRPGSNERYENSTLYGPFRFLIFILNK